MILVNRPGVSNKSVQVWIEILKKLKILRIKLFTIGKRTNLNFELNLLNAFIIWKFVWFGIMRNPWKFYFIWSCIRHFIFAFCILLLILSAFNHFHNPPSCKHEPLLWKMRNNFKKLNFYKLFTVVGATC